MHFFTNLPAPGPFPYHGFLLGFAFVAICDRFVKWRKKMHIGENEWRRYFSYQGTVHFGIGPSSLLKLEMHLWLKYL